MVIILEGLRQESGKDGTGDKAKGDEQVYEMEEEELGRREKDRAIYIFTQ